MHAVGLMPARTPQADTGPADASVDSFARTPRRGPSGTGKPAARDSADPIATGLRELFGEIANEPIPDEFIQLLDRIEAKERAAGRDASSSESSGCGER